MTTANLTPASLELFSSLVAAAPNWGGTPLLELTTSEKGNLIHLKKAGLVKTFSDDGCTFASFTPAGEELATSVAAY